LPQTLVTGAPTAGGGHGLTAPNPHRGSVTPASPADEVVRKSLRFIKVLCGRFDARLWVRNNVGIARR
jgi:hypothetical protein